MSNNESNLLAEHAFFFLANADKILADPKMSLVPVPETNFLIYSGTSGFRDPTLGVYLKWWLCTPCSMIENEGKKFLIWQFGGSPFSGMNSCKTVDEHGEIHVYHSNSFHDLWHNFAVVNKSFNEIKHSVEPYGLEEVYDLLGGADAEADPRFPLMIDNVFLQSKVTDLKMKLDKTATELSSVKEELIQTKISTNETVLRDIYLEYQQLDSQCKQRIAEIHSLRRDLKSKLKSGTLDNHQYQRELKPLQKELNHLQYNTFTEIAERVRPFGLDLQTVIAHFDASHAPEQDEHSKS